MAMSASATRDSHKTRADFDSEEEYVRWYVLERELVRPPYALLRFMVWLLGFAAWIAAGGLAGQHFGMGAWAWIVAVATAIIAFSRVLIISAVKVYQRYTPDSVRRNCILMPTCSEYCILALKKYGVIRGCHKTIHRLFHTCIGDDYREDWP